MNRRWLLTGALTIMAGWAFYSELLVPLRERERTDQGRIAELSAQMAAARAVIDEIRGVEQQAAKARVELDYWSRERPASSAVLWFPEQIRQHFRRFGIAGPVARLNTVKEEPELPGFERTYWRIALPFEEANKGVSGVMLAVAELEAQDPTVKVLDFVIWPDPENPSQRIAGINVATLARK